LELVKEDTPPSAPVPSQLLDQLTVHPQPLPPGKDSDTAEDRRARRLLELLSPRPTDKPTGERRFPWPLDILFYPFSLSGLITLVVCLFFPFLLGFFPMGGYSLLAYRSWGITGMLSLYLAWYLAECVYDSAKGGTRAPEILDMSGWEDLWSRVSYLLGVYILFGLPPVLYRLITGQMDALFWALVAWAVLFFPIGLLAMVIHDSTAALNPLFLLKSIFQVFVPYVGLLLGIGVLAGLLWYASAPQGPGLSPIRNWPFGALLHSYAAFILAHVLGRFYWRYRERLDWGI
jgi:hypothetical protein